MLTYKDFYFSHAASNNDPNYCDLEFSKDGKTYIFRDIEAPEGWDGKSDWTDEEDYIMSQIEGMEPEEVDK